MLNSVTNFHNTRSAHPSPSIPMNSAIDCCRHAGLVNIVERFRSIVGSDVIDDLQRRVRIFCLVLTTPENKERAMAVKNTWVSRCSGHIYVSSTANSSLPAIGESDSYGLHISNEQPHFVLHTGWNTVKALVYAFYADQHNNNDRTAHFEEVKLYALVISLLEDFLMAND
ncbi:unnamed protein product [Dicrocoelium dendriticum]|nr:unnamed protein product [Dicrocoelium dendriticum]